MSSPPFQKKSVSQPEAYATSPRWMRAGSLLTLTGYMSQMACQFLVVSGLGLASPSRAMDKPDFEVQPHPSLNQRGRRPSTPDAQREAFLRNIVVATEAEYDWPLHVAMALKDALGMLQEGDLKVRLAKLLDQIKQPEDLLFFGPGETERIFYRKGLGPDHSAFGTFRFLMQQIDSLPPHLEGNLQNDLQNLKFFYGRYINTLCNCDGDPDRIGQLLDKKVFLKAEGVTDPPTYPLFGKREETPGGPPLPPYGFYRISQEMARQLISRDRYGFVDRRNETGLNAVRSRGGVHFKLLGNALDEGPRPGIEYMAYAFAKAFSTQFLVTPSTLLKLEGVSLFDPAENFPPQTVTGKTGGEKFG